MALIKCKECGNQISKSAKSCPNCGAPREKAQGGISLAKFLVIALGVVFIFSLFSNDPKPTRGSSASEPAKPVKKWLYHESQNPVDDSTTAMLILEPDTGKNYKGTFDLTARCKSNKTELYVQWRDYLGDDSDSVYEDWKHVLVRVGESTAKTQRWSISTDKTATFSRSAIPLLREIAKNDRLLLETTPYNENPQQAIYDTTGLKEPIAKIAKLCNWSL